MQLLFFENSVRPLVAVVVVCDHKLLQLLLLPSHTSPSMLMITPRRSAASMNPTFNFTFSADKNTNTPPRLFLQTKLHFVILINQLSYLCVCVRVCIHMSVFKEDKHTLLHSNGLLYSSAKLNVAKQASDE